jgi:hypothetical protein
MDSTLQLTDTYSRIFVFSLYRYQYIQNQRPPAGSLRNTKSQNINMKKFYYKAVAVYVTVCVYVPAGLPKISEDDDFAAGIV